MNFEFVSVNSSKDLGYTCFCLCIYLCKMVPLYFILIIPNTLTQMVNMHYLISSLHPKSSLSCASRLPQPFKGIKFRCNHNPNTFRLYKSHCVCIFNFSSIYFAHLSKNIPLMKAKVKNAQHVQFCSFQRCGLSHPLCAVFLWALPSLHGI